MPCSSTTASRWRNSAPTCGLCTSGGSAKACDNRRLPAPPRREAGATRTKTGRAGCCAAPFAPSHTMLFNSYAFIFAFFPIVLFGFFLVGWRSTRAAAGFLALASLFFYGWWSIEAMPLLLASICINYWFGLQLTPQPGRSDAGRKRMLVLALTVNLVVLGIFKYA